MHDIPFTITQVGFNCGNYMPTRMRSQKQWNGRL